MLAQGRISPFRGAEASAAAGRVARNLLQLDGKRAYPGLRSCIMSIGRHNQSPEALKEIPQAIRLNPKTPSMVLVPLNGRRFQTGFRV